MEKVPEKYHIYCAGLLMGGVLYATIISLIWGTYQISEFYGLSNYPYLDPQSIIGEIAHMLPSLGVACVILPHMLAIPFNYELNKVLTRDENISPSRRQRNVSPEASGRKDPKALETIKELEDDFTRDIKKNQ